MAIKRVGNITINYTVPEAQTQLYNAIGRTAGNQAATLQNTNQGGGDNFFTKRGRSIENAFGTTGSAIVSAVNDRIENDRIERDRKDARRSMNDIAKKYGYNSWSDWQDANAAARESGDTEAIKRFDTQLKEFQAQANANAAKANEKAANYEDYRKNDYISNKINQDQGKFAGSAINTLSTAVDVTGLGATPVSNAIQGGIEGVADELEQNGFENFDWGRAGQNAAIGATTGAVTGALNAGISNSLAKRAAAKGLTNTATKAGLGSALKNGARTIATGAARGALSGAVGGATGAGLQSAMNGVEFGQGVQNALQGAVQGARQGAVTGGIMAGANAAFGKTNFGKQLQNAKTNWDRSGSNFDERLTNTLTSGDSAVGDWLMNKRQSNVLGAAGNLGNKIRFDEDGNMVLYRGQKGLDDLYYNSDQEKGTANLEGAYFMTPDEEQAAAFGNDIVKLKLTPEQQKQFFLSKEQYAKLTDDAAKQVSDYDYMDRLYQSDPEAAERIETMALGRPNDVARLSNKPIVQNDATDIDEMFVYKGINPEFDELVKSQLAQPTTAKGWAKKAGQRIVEDINNSNLGNRVKDVSPDMPEDIRNMQIRDYNANADGEGGLTYQETLNRGLDQGLSGSELADTLAPYSNLPAKVTGQELYELTQNDPQLRMAASYVANQIADDGGTPSYSNVANRYWDEVRAQYAQAQNYNGPGDYFDGTETYEMTAPRGAARARASVQTAQVDPWDRVAQEAGYSNYDEVLQRYAEANPNAKINPRGMAGQVLTWMDQNPNTPTTASGWAKRAGQRAVEDINNSNLGLRVQDVSQDGAQEAILEADNPQTRLYRMLAGGQASPTETITNAEYGESGLANRTKRGMVANALERTGNFLEGAQSNATRAQLKDLGIESAGKSIENVRKKTGITNLETQATFAKELTGGADSLMDNVQKLALTESADGKPYTVDTSDIAAKVESIVDKYADTNTFGSQSKRNQFISNLRRDISNYDTDILSIANRMKSNAADYRGRGVADPKPADAAKAKIYTDVANELENLSYKAIPQENIDAMFDTTISEMQNRAAQAKANGNNEIARAYTKAANQLNNEPRTVKAFRSFKKDFVDVGKINQVSARAENGAAAQMGRSFGSGMKRLTGTLLQRPVNAVLAKAGGAINTVADKIDNSGRVVNPQVASPAELANTVADYNPSTQLYNAIGRTEGTLAQETPAQYLENAAQEAEIVSPMETPTAPTNDIATSMGDASTATYNALTGTPTTAQKATTGSINTGYYQPTGDYWTDIIASAMSAAIDANDVDAFATLYGMYQDQMANLQKQTSSEKNYSDPTNWSSADRTKLLSAQNAMGQIDQLEEAYNQATGGEGSNAIQGWLRSRASDISGGNWDPSASNYNSLSESVGMGIVKNLINLGVTEADAERYLKYLPALTDTKEQAAQKLDTLRGIYQNQINNLYGAYGL